MTALAPISVPAALLLWAASVETATGFTVVALDVVEGQSFRLCLKRGSTQLIADADALGRCSLTEEHHSIESVAVGRRGDRQRVERVSIGLVSRRHATGIRSLLRATGARIGDRNVLRPLLQGNQ